MTPVSVYPAIIAARAGTGVAELEVVGRRLTSIVDQLGKGNYRDSRGEDGSTQGKSRGVTLETPPSPPSLVAVTEDIRPKAEVPKNRGGAGVDQQTIEDVEAYGVGLFLTEIHHDLREKQYYPQPVRRVWIPKPGKPGQLRGLGIPAIRDRVVQTAVKIVIEPLLEADFRDCSYGFRPKRGAQQAIAEIQTYLKME